MENATVPKENHDIYPIKVNIRLKPEMNIGYNKWKCTLSSEDRLVTLQNVQFYAKNLQEAISGFNPDEVEEVTINAMYPKR